MLWGWWPMSVWPAVAHSLVSIRSRSRWPTCCSRRHRCPRTFLGRCGRWWPRRSPNSRHRPPDASVFGHQLLGLRKALSTPELDAGGSVGVAFDKDDQPTDRPPRPIFGHGSQGRLTTAAGRPPSGGLSCFTLAEPASTRTGPPPAYPSRPHPPSTSGAGVVWGYHPAARSASWRPPRRVSTHCCTRRSRGWPARSARPPRVPGQPHDLPHRTCGGS
jgi:hypothetical protein